MAKRRRRSRAKRKRRGALLIVALLVLVAGFVARRVLAPRAMHFLTHRAAAPTSRPAMAANPAPGEPGANGMDGNLTDADRRALDRLVGQRAGGR